MNTEKGLWIDHTQAILVINPEESVFIRVISNLEKRVRYSGASHSRDSVAPHDATTEDGRDRRFDERLNHYYDEVISYLRDADAVLILGPGEAPMQLRKRMVEQGLGKVPVVIEAADKLTDEQIVAAIRQHFQQAPHHSH